MTDPKILLKQFLSEIIKLLILRPQSVRRRDTTHTRHFMHVHQCPTARKERVVLAINEHHAWHDPYVMLPAVAQLMPPLPFDDLRLINLVDGPEIRVGFVEEDGLENVIVVGDGCFVCVVVHAELVLVVCTIEGHFDLCHVLGVRMCVVHGSVPRGFSALTFPLVLGEGDLIFLVLTLGFSAELGVEACLEIFFKVLGVGVGDGDVVEEVGTTEDELLAPGGGLTE